MARAQPGVLLALRMVVAVDANPGDFFETLFEESVSEAADGVSSPPQRVSVTYQPLGAVDELKSIFGPLLAQARLAVGMVADRHGKKRGL